MSPPWDTHMHSTINILQWTGSSLRNMFDASSGGSMLSKSYENGYKLDENITTNTYQWPVTRVVVSTQKKLTSVHKVTETTTLALQVSQIHQMMKNMLTSPDVPTTKPVKVATNTSTVACLYCRGITCLTTAQQMQFLLTM